MDMINMGAAIVQTGLPVTGAIVKAAPTHRQCNIEITNDSVNYILCNPRMYINKGRCRKPLPPTIKQSTSGEVEFTKTRYTASGSIGIFTYALLNNTTKEATEQIAVLFKVPFDLNSKLNEYAVGVFDMSMDCNRDLYQKMSKKTGTAFVRGQAKGPSLTYKGQNVTIMATMSDCYKPVIKVQVSDN